MISAVLVFVWGGFSCAPIRGEKNKPTAKWPMSNRSMIDDFICTLCHDYSESFDHVILEACPAKGSRQARESFFNPAPCSIANKIPAE
ncbi:MAG: hypothetical protein ACREOI_03620 [bacterium]